MDAIKKKINWTAIDANGSTLSARNFITVDHFKIYCIRNGFRPIYSPNQNKQAW
ncbi:hypothetical protein [Ekhidna sp.]